MTCPDRPPTLDVLISTIPHRHEKLCRLLAELDRQAASGFGVLLLRDNLERPGLESHAKRQDLINASGADYVCFVDDDDRVPDYYVAELMAALASWPHYVGFTVDFIDRGTGGVRQHRRVEHSLRHPDWRPDGDCLLRDVSHLNPIRADLARYVSWSPPNPLDKVLTDDEYARLMRATGLLQTEVFIDRDMYIYHRDDTDWFWADRRPMELPLPVLPSYPWLRVL